MKLPWANFSESTAESRKPIGHCIHANQLFRLKSKPPQVLLNGFCKQILENLSQFFSDKPLRGFLQTKRSLHPTRSHILSQFLDFLLQSLIRFPVLFGIEFQKLAFQFCLITAKFQVFIYVGGQEIMGVSTDCLDFHAQFFHKFRRENS
jgi:hypothetical protein